jgi:hypothetical protein
MNNKINTDKKIKMETFLSSEYRKLYQKHKLSGGNDLFELCSNYYKIFGRYKYNPKISHWKNFCNRLKWPLPHEKLENVIMTRGNKIMAVFVVSVSLAYAIKGGPKYTAFWLWLFVILGILSPLWILPLIYPEMYVKY